MTQQLYAALAAIRTFLGRHHPVLFISTLCLLLAIAVFSLYEVLTLTASDPIKATSTVSGFDEKTVQKIKGLHDSTDTDDSVNLPSSRPNPFVE